MYALAEALTIPLPYAIGIMQLLWEHAAQHTPRGDIGSLPDDSIKQACNFSRKAGILIDALVNCGWVDRDGEYRLVIHDWPEHCEQSVKKWLDYNHKTFLPIYGKSPEKLRRNSGYSPPSREVMAVVEVSEDLKEKKDGEILRPEFDDQWQDLLRLYNEIGKPLIKQDFDRAHLVWRLLDFEQKTHAIVNLAARKLHHDPQFIPKPENYLRDSEYTRPVLPRKTNGNSRHDQIRRAMEEA